MSQETHATLAGNPVHMIRPHLRDVPEVGLPKGYAIRPLRVEEGAVWTDVVLDAEPWLELSKELFTNEFAHDLSSVPERCFFVVDGGTRRSAPPVPGTKTTTAESTTDSFTG